MKKIIFFTSLALLLGIFVISCSQEDQVPQGSPSITGISPASGPSGTQITITGQNFSNVAEATTVRIGNVLANITSISDTEISAIVPKGATNGSVSITIDGNTVTGGSFTMTGKPPKGGLVLSKSELLLYPFPRYAKQLGVVTEVNGPVVWSSSNENVATVDQNGLVTPLTIGTAIITASAGTSFGNCEVTVADGPVTKLTLDQTELDLYTGESATLSIATLKANVSDPGDPVWSTDNDEVATVDQQGNVTAITKGTANIFVTVDNASASCKVTVQPDVYVVGFQYDGNVEVATLWKNGVAYPLGNAMEDSQAFSVWVDQGDVYVAGQESINGIVKAQLWVNGNPTNPINGQLSSDFYAVVKEGNNIYTGGGEFENGISVAKLWVNGVENVYSNGINHAHIWDVFVSAQNVYAAGSRVSNGNDLACFWINGVQTDLTMGLTNANGRSIYSENNNIYIAGNEIVNNTITARLWTNGMPATLSQQSGSCEAVVMANNNLYVVGYEFINGYMRATLWTNGVPLHLQGGDITSWGHSVFVHGSDVYVAGQSRNNGIIEPRLWKNGTSINLAHNPNHDAGIFGSSAVFVD
ncbi:Ig-like domain-containing protein [Flagellimonas meishanensis]|uniref:Ig-like domain-containing protein n=1 Tax=Flagellimonas meishanensis TaxID=2873264 RepID=UPI001CA70804|nr:Ig-like domain-containing protein [[Muricauda] meishanensis]